MKKVLLISAAPLSLTGITSVIMNYVRQTRTRVHYEVIATGRIDEKISSELQSYGYRSRVAPISRLKRPIKYFRWLKGVIKSGGYDVVHIHGNSGTVCIEARAAKAARVPVIIGHSHSTSTKFPLVHRLTKPALNRTVTHAIACSDLAGKWLFTQEYTVLENAIDVDRFRFCPSKRKDMREQLGLSDKLVIGHIGYMEEVKNHLYLLRVMKRLVEKDKNAHLLLIGDGSLRPVIEKYISDNALADNVTLLGRRADVEALYCAMDVFTLPSLYEGLPVTSVEAQASGLPCLVSDKVTRQTCITESVWHIGIDDADVDTWVSAILAVKDLRIDRDNAYLAVKDTAFDVQSNAQKLIKIYES